MTHTCKTMESSLIVKPETEETGILRDALSSNSFAKMIVHYLDFVLRSKHLLFGQIVQQRGLTKSILCLSVLTIIMAGVYGFFMGIGNGFQQMIASGVKLPLLFILTTLFSVPSLYVFSVLLGHKFRFKQTVALQLTSISVTSILLASLTPLTLICYMSQMSYKMMILLHVGVMALCGAYGVNYLRDGFAHISSQLRCSDNDKLLKIWIGVYAFTGVQLSWFLRPFIGNSTEPFTWFRAQSGEFFSAVFKTLMSFLTIS